MVRALDFLVGQVMAGLLFGVGGIVQQMDQVQRFPPQALLAVAAAGMHLHLQLLAGLAFLEWLLSRSISNG